MLERYFVRPETVDRIRACWLGSAIERYTVWLSEQGYSARSIQRRVPILMQVARFALDRGATTCEALVRLAPEFVERWVEERAPTPLTPKRRDEIVKEVRGPIEQLLRLEVPGFVGAKRRPKPDPLAATAPRFFAYLTEERGLRPATLLHYRHHLRNFESFLARIGLDDIRTLSPAVLTAFVADSSARLGKTGVRDVCGTLRVLLRYLYRERVLPADLSASVGSPQAYRLSTIPRSVTWEEVQRMLATVERRAPVGKRDYAILLLLVTYGLRAREVAALTLDDIDWRRDRLRIPERKAGHSTAFPLSTTVGEALLDYIQNARPQTQDRHVFFRVVAPPEPLTWHAVSGRASHYLRRAGIAVSRAGSHTLRHTCVQRLVDAEFSLKQIGDYIGHRAPSSTGIYSKVAVETLRELAMGDGEEVL